MIPWFTALPFFHCLDFKKKEAYHLARFEKGSRYYILHLEKDLLDDWTITAINGRIKSKLGQSRTLAFPTFAEAFDSFCELAKLRYQRHYQLKIIAIEVPLLLCLLPFLLQVEKTENKASTRVKTKEKSLITTYSQSANLYQTTLHQMNLSF